MHNTASSNGNRDCWASAHTHVYKQSRYDIAGRLATVHSTASSHGNRDCWTNVNQRHVHHSCAFTVTPRISRQLFAFH